jgi:hypothetical protein
MCNGILHGEECKERPVSGCVCWYSVSLVFFFIGTALYYFQQHPELIDAVKQQVALNKGVSDYVDAGG